MANPAHKPTEGTRAQVDALAAEKNGRIACMMELDLKYCDVIVKRWQDFTGKQATLEADGRTFAEVAGDRAQA